jgi:hypothetical protein
VNARERDAAGVEARLAEAASCGETVEVILVVRGRLRRGARSGRWRIRGAGQGVLSFPPGAVVAITPVAQPSRRRRSAS